LKILRTFLILLLLIFISIVTFFIVKNYPKNNSESISLKSQVKSKTIKKIPKKKIIPKIDLVAVGDNLIHMPIVRSSKLADGSYNFKPIYSEIENTVEKADISFLNQETILGGTELGISGYPQFNSPHELGRDMVELGFDVINHATNHSLDKGEKGILSALKFWENYQDVKLIGIYNNQEARDNISIVEKNGIKLAFLAYTYSTNGIPVPSGKPYLVNIINKELIQKDIENAKTKADAVIVSMHWGIEYQTTPSDIQKELAKFMADAGVLVIIGHHPHVLQPAEIVESNSGQKTLVAYSLGNFVSSQVGMSKLIGGLLKTTITKDTNNNIIFKDSQIEPLVTHIEPGYKSYKIIPLDDYTKDLATKHINRYREKPLNLDSMKTYTKNILNDFYIED